METATLPDPAELAATALRTLHLAEVAALRPRLLPELAGPQPDARACSTEMVHRKTADSRPRANKELSRQKCWLPGAALRSIWLQYCANRDAANLSHRFDGVILRRRESL